MRKLTNVTFDQAKSVRSKKQQTTPRLLSAVTQSKSVGAVQIAPPVRAGPSSKVYRPPPVLTSSSASELATSTPRSATLSKSLSEVLEISKIPVDHERASVSKESSIKEPIDKPIEVVGDDFDRHKLTEPPLIIKPSYEIPVVNPGVSEERLDDRLGELKNWIESELLHKLIEAKRQKPEPKPTVEPFHHSTELRDENALRLLIENKFRTALENRKQPLVVDKPRVIREISIEQKSCPDSTSSISSVYKPLQLRMEHFYDETVAEVSTPVVTPVASIIEPIEQKVEMIPPPPPPPVVDNTLDNIIDDEDTSSYCPLPQSSAHNSSLGSIIGGSLATPIYTESQKTLSEVSIQNHSTPVNTIKSKNVRRRLQFSKDTKQFNESIKSSAPTPVRSSTPGREVSSKPRPKLSAAVQVTVHPTVVPERPKEKSISSFSQSSTYISSTDDSISPGQILNSFGEFKISQRIKDKIAHGRDSLSEGEIPPQSMATTIDDGLSSGREGLSDGEIKPQKIKKMTNHLAKLDEKLDEMSLADSEKQNDDTENDIQESLISSSNVPSENYSHNLESSSKTSTEHHSSPS